MKKSNILKASPKSILKAAKILKSGGVVAFPTETVYGLGANAFNSEAVAKIFEIKERPNFDPLIVHVSKKNQLSLIAESIPKKVKKLIDKFWPGPLTIILKKKKKLPDIVTGGLDTVAVRMPSSKIALELIKKSGCPIAAPSANKFSRVSPVRASHVVNQLGRGPDLIIDGGKTIHGVESTIIAFEKGVFYLLRPGAIGLEEIEEKTGFKVKVKKTGKLQAPGQLKKHYAPKANLSIINGGEKIDANSAYIAFKKRPYCKCKVVKILSPKGDLKEAAANLFDFFHFIERSKIKKIYIEKVPHIGLGLAINDRIMRAATKK